MGGEKQPQWPTHRTCRRCGLRMPWVESAACVLCRECGPSHHHARCQQCGHEVAVAEDGRIVG